MPRGFAPPFLRLFGYGIWQPRSLPVSDTSSSRQERGAVCSEMSFIGRSKEGGRVGPRRRVGVEDYKHKPYEPEAAARSASWIFRGAHDPQETPAAAASASSSGIVSGASSQPPSCARAAVVGAMRGRHSSLKSRSSLSSRSPTKCGYQSKILDNTSAVATDRLSDDVKPRKGK